MAEEQHQLFNLVHVAIVFGRTLKDSILDLSYLMHDLSTKIKLNY